MNFTIVAILQWVEKKKLYEEQFTDLNLLSGGQKQQQKFKEDISEHSDGSTIVIADYTMKLLFQDYSSPKKDWFGKKGLSLHNTMFLKNWEGN